MPEPIFPKLTLITVSIIPAFPGMIDLNNLEDLQFDPGLDSHPRAHKRIKKMIHEFVEGSLRLAHESGIGDPEPSQGIRIAVLPSLPGELMELCCAWRGRGGLSYIGSTVPLPHIVCADSNFVGYDFCGRAVIYQDAPAHWISATAFSVSSPTTAR